MWCKNWREGRESVFQVQITAMNQERIRLLRASGGLVIKLPDPGKDCQIALFIAF